MNNFLATNDALIQGQSGLTLFELLTTLAIVAILAAVAVPGFRTISLNSARTAAVNEALGAIMIARNESVKRGVNVQVCGSANGSSCISANDGWAAGLLVVADSNNDNSFDTSSDATILYTGAVDQRISLKSNRSQFTFRPFNQPNTNGTLSVCDKRGASDAHAIIVALSGRPSVSSNGASDANC